MLKKLANFVPLDLLKKLTGNKNGLDIEIITDSKTSKRNLRVTMPDYIDKCFQPKVTVKKAEGNKVLVVVQNLNQSINDADLKGFKGGLKNAFTIEK